MQAFVTYSIPESDAHMVYELGGLLEQQGYSIEYNYKHPEHPNGQHSFDAIAVSGMFVGLITAHRDSKSVIQFWQYAKSQGIPAVILAEDKMNLPGSLAKDPDVIIFRRFMPENPIKYIEIWVSHQFR